MYPNIGFMVDFFVSPLYCLSPSIISDDQLLSLYAVDCKNTRGKYFSPRSAFLLKPEPLIKPGNVLETKETFQRLILFLECTKKYIKTTVTATSDQRGLHAKYYKCALTILQLEPYCLFHGFFVFYIVIISFKQTTIYCSINAHGFI